MDTHDEKKYRDARLSADWGWTGLQDFVSAAFYSVSILYGMGECGL